MYKNFRVGGGIVLGLSALVLSLAACTATIDRNSDNNIKKVINKGNKSFDKVTSLEQIKDGSTVLFGYNDTNFAGEFVSISSKAIGFEKAELASAKEIIIGIVDTYYTFKVDEKYLASTSTLGKLELIDSVTNNAKWTLKTNSSAGTISIKNLVKSGSDDQYLQYNTSNPRFITYKNTMKDFSIYYEVPSVKTYSVTFECEGQDNKVSSVVYDTIPEKPANPTKKSKIYDYTFDGWYNKVTNIKYNFDTALNADTILVAKFIETKKTYENIFKQIYLLPSASLEYKYKETSGENSSFTTVVENGSKSSKDGYFTTSGTTIKSDNTNKLGFKEADSTAHFSNDGLNSDVTLSFNYNVTGSGSYLNITFTYEKGSKTVKADTTGKFSYTTSEDNAELGYLTSIDFTTNKVSGSNVWLNTITVTGEKINLIREYGNFANPAIIVSYNYSGYEELTEVTEMGFAFSETNSNLTTENIKADESSVLTHSFDSLKIDGTYYSCGYKLSLDTINVTYSKDYYFAAYFVVSGEYYISNIKTTNFKDVLASTIKNEEKSTNVITAFETAYNLAA